MFSNNKSVDHKSNHYGRSHAGYLPAHSSFLIDDDEKLTITPITNGITDTLNLVAIANDAVTPTELARKYRHHLGASLNIMFNDKKKLTVQPLSDAQSSSQTDSDRGNNTITTTTMTTTTTTKSNNDNNNGDKEKDKGKDDDRLQTSHSSPSPITQPASLATAAGITALSTTIAGATLASTTTATTATTAITLSTLPEVATIAAATTTATTAAAAAAPAACAALTVALPATIAATAAVATVPFWLAAFRVRMDVLWDVVSKNVTLVDGTWRVVSGRYGGARRMSGDDDNDGNKGRWGSAREVSRWIDGESRRRWHRAWGREGDDDGVIGSGDAVGAVDGCPVTLAGDETTCFQFYNTWGSARGCTVLLSYRLHASSSSSNDDDDDDLYVVALLHNPYDRNFQRLCLAIGIVDHFVQMTDEQVGALLELARKKYNGFGFASCADFSATDGIACASVRRKGWCVTAKMSALRRSTVSIVVRREEEEERRGGERGGGGGVVVPHQPPLSAFRMFRKDGNEGEEVATTATTPTETTNSDVDPTTYVRLRDAKKVGHLAATLTMLMERSCFTDDARRPPGRLTYKDGGMGCLRVMKVTFLDSNDDDVPREAITDRTKVIRLPTGATQIKVSFKVVGGPMVKKIHRRDPRRPWIRSDSGECIVDEFDFDQGDGVDAVFEVCGTSLHSYVKMAWDFGREPDVPPRPWEWWEDTKTMDRWKLLPNAAQVKDRLKLIEDMSAVVRRQ